MKAKDKAKQLIHTYYNDLYHIYGLSVKDAKECALTCVNEIIESWKQYKGMYEQEFFDVEVEYWEEVIKEIENYDS